MATDMNPKSNDVVVASNSSSSMMNSCWKKQCIDTGSLWGNFKNQLNVFIHTPIKDHKDCFKFTCHAMMDKFSSKQSDFEADDSMELPLDRDFL